ncbi:MAG: L-lactate dehydrogenase [Ruminococcaceae bacterium]|nr:L-lactate dehydrogenase [Oscillospiraceae bacterium]
MSLLDNRISIHHRRVAIIGVGYVGASIAYALTVSNLAREIILIDIDREKAAGEALDIQHGIPLMGSALVHAGDYCDCKDCDLIIITAGRNRRPNETRLDMTQDNVKIIREVAGKIKPHYTKGAIMVVANPVDVLTYECDRLMELPNGRVFGTGCVLDTSRLVRGVANYTGLKIEAIKCNIVGEHGDSQFPVWSRLAIAGVPMDEYCRNVKLPWGDEQKDAIFGSVRNMGATIIAAKGRTHYGIATCVCSLADAVLNQRLTIAPVTTPLQGEYGIRDVSLSLPSIIGVNGVEMRLEENWQEAEYKRLQESAEKLKATIARIN